ncbi:hypothetical protein [uncultured Methanolobus sp.]|uniref:hypothetical protein n=1 Tax=uncultured Methanolobus sp. TaxID=218300 RepID=UPI002AAB1B08|nr:hypothetical protein [uncultured Methanolobus sp.]
MYNSDLVAHYQTAISTTNPHFRFLAYYHVLEHYFKEIYWENLVNLVANKITHPSFSYSSTEDIKKLISIIQKNIKKNDPTIDYPEFPSLIYVLNKFVDVDHIAKELYDSDPALIAHYKNPVPFLGKKGKIDFNLTSNTVIEAIATRVYNVRNSIVHSKKGNTQICIPFKHDHQLKMEIPLIKIIAEEIIINTSDTIINQYEDM